MAIGVAAAVGQETTATITVNGRARTVLRGATLAALLGELQLDPHLIDVEHNRTILRDRDQLDHVVLRDGDTLELVHFVGGG